MNLPSLQKQTWWALGPHRLYCGHPCSAPFREHLPRQVALLLIFPPDPLDTVPPPTEAASVLTFASVHPTRDGAKFQEAVERFLLIGTDAGDELAIADLPDPSLILWLNSLEC